MSLAGEIAPTCRRDAARWAEREREERCTASDETAPRDGSRLTAYPRSRRFPGPEPYEDDRPDAVSPPMEPSVPARLATSSGSGASRRRTASASCAGDSPVRAAFARSRSSRFSRRRCLADCFSPNKVSRLEVDPQFNRPDRRNSRSPGAAPPLSLRAICGSADRVTRGACSSSKVSVCRRLSETPAARDMQQQPWTSACRTTRDQVSSGRPRQVRSAFSRLTARSSSPIVPVTKPNA